MYIHIPPISEEDTHTLFHRRTHTPLFQRRTHTPLFQGGSSEIGVCVSSSENEVCMSSFEIQVHAFRRTPPYFTEGQCTPSQSCYPGAKVRVNSREAR